VQVAGTRSLEAFRGRFVHAVAGIGHPERFFRLLESHGINVIPHPRPDHAILSQDTLDFSDGLDVFMTEKDAVKLRGPIPANWWYVSVELKLRGDGEPEWLENLATTLKARARERRAREPGTKEPGAREQ
jgi:tetraacyldisaccharide 4'-kinase